MREKTVPSPAGIDTRRNFIKKAATAAAAVATVNVFKTPVYGQNTAPSTGRVIGANDRIVVGFIGVGPQGTLHVNKMVENADKNNVAFAAVCDLWEKRRAAAKAVIGKDDVKLYDKYQDLLDRKDIDAVICATHDVWHAQVSIDVMETGKHVYCEKPMTRYLPEAWKVLETVKRTGKIYQVGTQGCSDAKWQKCAELVRAGKIGQLVLGQGSYMRNTPTGEWNYKIDPDLKADSIDWETWQGPNVKKRIPFNPDHYFRWRKYYPFCAGLLGDLFPHRLNPHLLATGNPEFACRVVAIGTKAIHTDKNTPGTPERDSPECITVVSEFPSGYSLIMISSSVNEQGLEDVIRGNKATLHIGASTPRVQLMPERPYSDELDPEDYQNLLPVEDIGTHESNWLACIRENKQPHANIELAVRGQTVISLGEMSQRLGIACHYDGETRTLKDGSGKQQEVITYGTLPLS
jgi:predicted dehydrogenase